MPSPPKSGLAPLFALLAVATACGGGDDAPGPDDQGPRPSVVLLILDTLRADRLGCYGCAHEVSPELDALARQGVVFESVTAQVPWTRPSIGSMLTSRYPRTLGIYDEQEGVLDDRFTTLAECFDAAGYETLGLTANPHLNRSFNFHQGFDEYHDSFVVFSFMAADERQPVFERSKLLSARQLFTKALEEVRSRPAAAPWYVQLNVMDVHEWYRRAFSLTRPEYGQAFPGIQDRFYLQAVRQVSADAGAFLRELLALPGFEDALVVFTSDHGEGLWDHPAVKESFFHGRTLYDSQVRVPWILWRKGQELAGRRVERPVRLLDLMPTVLECAGLPVPPDCAGESLMALLEDPSATVPLPEYFVTETELRDHRKAAVSSAEWRYIESDDGHEGTAPRELQRIGTAQNGGGTSKLRDHEALASAMARYLADWMVRVPRVEPTISPSGISEAEQEQLRNIGYLGGKVRDKGESEKK